MQALLFLLAVSLASEIILSRFLIPIGLSPMGLWVSRSETHSKPSITEISMKGQDITCSGKLPGFLFMSIVNSESAIFFLKKKKISKIALPSAHGERFYVGDVQCRGH